jgi:CubicO group peptidase (beta-lactamase class C family)
LHALLVYDGGQAVFERYGDGHGPAVPHALYSGTKSFWGVAAAAASRDGLLLLDEPVAATFPAWETDPWKRRVTLRQLLNLTSGIGFGGLGNAVPTYEQSLETVLKNEPGTRFTYGGIPLQVFGAVLERKLASRKQSPHEYLDDRILNPLGVRVAKWRALKDGRQPLPTGAFLTAREWAKYGEYLRTTARTDFPECFEGSEINPRYGLGVWLHPVEAPPDVAHASGSGGQALYTIPSTRTTIVHFGQSGSWRHEAFLRRALKGSSR